MFTGIVQERGRVASFENGRLVVESSLQPAIGAEFNIAQLNIALPRQPLESPLHSVNVTPAFACCTRHAA